MRRHNAKRPNAQPNANGLRELRTIFAVAVSVPGSVVAKMRLGMHGVLKTMSVKEFENVDDPANAVAMMNVANGGVRVHDLVHRAGLREAKTTTKNIREEATIVTVLHRAPLGLIRRQKTVTMTTRARPAYATHGHVVHVPDPALLSVPAIHALLPKTKFFQKTLFYPTIAPWYPTPANPSPRHPRALQSQQFLRNLLYCHHLLHKRLHQSAENRPRPKHVPRRKRALHRPQGLAHRLRLHFRSSTQSSTSTSIQVTIPG